MHLDLTCIRGLQQAAIRVKTLPILIKVTMNIIKIVTEKIRMLWQMEQSTRGLRPSCSLPGPVYNCKVLIIRQTIPAVVSLLHRSPSQSEEQQSPCGKADKQVRCIDP